MLSIARIASTIAEEITAAPIPTASVGYSRAAAAQNTSPNKPVNRLDAISEKC